METGMASVRAFLRLGKNETVLDLPEGISVQAVLEKLEPRWRDNVIVTANGRILKETDQLHGSDRILIFPLLAGG
jgi:sulfur carrier protein ThiS